MAGSGSRAGTSRDEPILRPTARVILLAPSGRTLLFRGPELDHTTGKAFWFPPGGAIEPGETPEQAARRELQEEVGLPARLGPVVWTRTPTWPWRGVWHRSPETHFVGWVEREAIDTAGWTPEERENLLEHRWWSLAEMQASADLMVPRSLAKRLPALLRGEAPASPPELAD